MKKILWIAVMTIGLSVTAQTAKFGITGGFNHSNHKTTTKVTINNLSAMNNESNSNFSSSGLFLGMFVDLKLSEKFSIQPELDYIVTFKNDNSFKLLSIPVLAKYYFAEKVYVQAGPHLDFILNNNENEMIKSTALGATTGLGYEINDHIFISGRYSFGLTNRFKGENITNNIVKTDTNYSINYLQIGVGYKF